MRAARSKARSTHGGRYVRGGKRDHASDALESRVRTVPTDQPEAEGTLERDAATTVIAELRSGAHSGIGYIYAHNGTVQVIADPLCEALPGRNPLDIPALWTMDCRSCTTMRCASRQADQAGAWHSSGRTWSVTALPR